MRKIVLAFLLASVLGVGKASGVVNASRLVQAGAPAGVTQNEVTLNFPASATFQLSVDLPVEIKSVVLEYGNEQQTCGNVVAKAFPQFTPGMSVDTKWTWEMVQTPLPPGAKLWWRWRITDANGNETVTDTQTAIWLDNVHRWQTIENGDFLRLHYYRGGQSFINTLSQAAAHGLKFNEEQSGLKADAPIDIYIYANNNDLKDAILYEPSWVGGQAYPDQNIVIIGISPDILDWGKDAMVHELTHVLVGHLTFSCLGDVPTWLNEGLAVYSEGKLDKQSQNQLNAAIVNDTLMSVRSLGGGFSEESDKANLSYSESYSLVNFLIEAFWKAKMTDLLVALRDGKTIDDALQQTYGFNVDGLEQAWRQSIEAQPRADSAGPTVLPTPTFVSTIIPISGNPKAALLLATPTARPTSTFIPTSTVSVQSAALSIQPTAIVPVQRARPPLGLTLILLAMCCIFILLAGILIIGILARRQNVKGGNNVK